jgi:hypothetical protein
MNSKDVGDISNYCIIAKLLKLGKKVLLPVGDNYRYDIVVEENGNFFRIQSKTGRFNKDKTCIKFETCSSQYHRGKKKIGYIGEIDYFAIYFLELDKVYLVPVADAPSTQMELKLKETLVNRKNVKWAKDYEIESAVLV